MAQLNITLDQDEILQLLGNSSGMRSESCSISSVNALLMEENARWAAMRRMYYKPAVEALDGKAEA